MPYAENVEDMQVPGGFIELKVPVTFEGLPKDAKVRDTNVAIQMEGSAFRYAPPWQSATLGEHALAFAVPMAVFNRLAGSAVSMHLELIAEELRPAQVVQSQASESFSGPMNGRCSLKDGRVRCRYAYREWVPTQVEANACGGLVTATLRHVPAGGAPDPVVNEELAFGKDVCAGDEIRFTEYGSAGRFRVSVDLPTANVRQYRVR